MKNTILFLLITLSAFSAEAQQRTDLRGNRVIIDNGLYFRNRWIDSLKNSITNISTNSERTIMTTKAVIDYVSANSGPGGDFDSSISLPNPVTTDIPGLKGKVLGDVSIQEAIRIILSQADPPRITLTGGTAREFMSSGANISTTKNWTVYRDAATETIDSIRINGVYQSFSQPAKPGSVSGTQSVSIPRNTNTTTTGYVRTSDGQVVSATTTDTWAAWRGYGWVSDTAGISGGGYDATIRALTGEVNSSKTKTWNTGNPSGEQFYVYAYIATAGTATSFFFNGFESIDLMNVITRSFTTSTGYTANYVICYTKFKQNTSSQLQVP